MTPEEHLALSEPHPEFLAFVQNNAPPPPPPADINFFRKMGAERLAKTLEDLPATPTELNEKEIAIPTRDASSVRAWIVSPNLVHATGSPVLLWFHGGGFCIGDAREELANARRWSSELGLIVISVNYRLAPEYKFPTAVYDGEDVLKWTLINALSINADISKGFLVGGVSAGANIAAALGLLARDHGLSPPLSGQILMAPPLLPKSEVEEKYKDRYLSQEQNNDDRFLTPEIIQMFEDSYAADPKSPLYAAFNHPEGHKNLPPTYIQVYGLDPLRDENLLYEEKLRLEFGVKTRLEVYKGLPHHFWGFFPMLSISKKHGDDTVEGIKWLLDLKKS